MSIVKWSLITVYLGFCMQELLHAISIHKYPPSYHVFNITPVIGEYTVLFLLLFSFLRLIWLLTKFSIDMVTGISNDTVRIPRPSTNNVRYITRYITRVVTRNVKIPTIWDVTQWRVNAERATDHNGYYTAYQLRTMCKEMGLRVSGVKATLVRRLNQFYGWN
jgi:hypothetical protein